MDTTGSLTAWLCLIYIDLLFCFLAISLHGWKRRILLIGAAAHILCSALRCFTSVTLFSGRLVDWLGFGLFLLTVLLMLLSHERMLRRTSLCLCGVAGVLFAAWCVSRFVGVEYLYPLSNPITSLLYGSPTALYTLLCTVAGLLCAAQVVAEFIRTAFSRQRQMIALQSRSQQAQEQYKQAQESLRNGLDEINERRLRRRGAANRHRSNTSKPKNPFGMYRPSATSGKTTSPCCRSCSARGIPKV